MVSVAIPAAAAPATSGVASSTQSAPSGGAEHEENGYEDFIKSIVFGG